MTGSGASGRVVIPPIPARFPERCLSWCMFFPAKYRNKGKRGGKESYVLEGPLSGSTAAMGSSSTFKFDKDSAAGLACKSALLAKLREIWCANMAI